MWLWSQLRLQWTSSPESLNLSWGLEWLWLRLWLYHDINTGIVMIVFGRKYSTSLWSWFVAHTEKWLCPQLYHTEPHSESHFSDFYSDSFVDIMNLGFGTRTYVRTAYAIFKSCLPHEIVEPPLVAPEMGSSWISWRYSFRGYTLFYS